MSARVVQFVQQNGPLLTAVLSSRTTNAMACRTLPSSTISGANPSKIDLSNIQHAVDLSSIQDAAAAHYAGVIIQGLQQGDLVDTTSIGSASDVIDNALLMARETPEERMANRQQGIQGDIEPSVSKEQTDNKTTVSNQFDRESISFHCYRVSCVHFTCVSRLFRLSSVQVCCVLNL